MTVVTDDVFTSATKDISKKFITSRTMKVLICVTVEFSSLCVYCY